MADDEDIPEEVAEKIMVLVGKLLVLDTLVPTAHFMDKFVELRGNFEALAAYFEVPVDAIWAKAILLRLSPGTIPNPKEWN